MSNVDGLTEVQWKQLLRLIERGACTPFLGAGVSHPPLPLGGALAERWADEHGYPMDNRTDLAAVADFLAVNAGTPMFPKDEIVQELSGFELPDDTPNEPHAVLASLPLPVYLTTNYDGFMTTALKRNGKDASQELCRWNTTLTARDWTSRFDDPDFEPTPERPVVFHWHGILQVRQSLVLSEEDYLDFLVNMGSAQALRYSAGRRPVDHGLAGPGTDPTASASQLDPPQRFSNAIPVRILESLSEGALLFMGYGLTDMTFRVVFRTLMRSTEDSLRDLSVAVQLRKDDEAMTQYLEKYFRDVRKIVVYWGSAQDFAAELAARWADHTLSRDGDEAP